MSAVNTRSARETMTSRERILAAIRGEVVDRFPVWLKMTNRTWQASQPDPWRRMGEAELLQACGCDLMLWNGLRMQHETPHAQIRVETVNGTCTTVADTPDGELVAVAKHDPGTDSWHPVSYFAEDEEDLPKLRWLFEDSRYTVEDDAICAARERQAVIDSLGGLSYTGVGPGPLMDMVEHLCGPVAWVYHQSDCPEVFAEVLQAAHEDRMRMLRARLPHEPSAMFWLTENTSTTLISPDVFREYCMPHLQAYGNLILEHGIIPVHHMCGTLNALLEMIDTLPALANEAYTTRPLGDVSLAEGRRRMPSKCLIGGTNATLWLESPERIVDRVREDLAACPDRRKIFLTSAGVLPAPVSLEKAKRVVEMLKALPV